MTESLTIDKNNKLLPSEDYEFLRREGLELIQSLSGNLWTDYNTHDPGITLLEAMCYALTDLGYRTSFDIKDILTPQKTSADTWKNLFFTAKAILPCNPLTLIDYRKLIIDTRGIKNAWIEKSDDYEILMYLYQHENKLSEADYRLTYDHNKGEEVLRLRGLYKVLIEYDKAEMDAEAKKNIRDVVRKKLHFHRNLCEDFINITEVEYEYFSIKAVIQVSEGTNIDAITADIFKIIYDFFSPPVTFYTYEQMLEKYNSAEEIFNGPALNYGFIDTEELLKTERYRNIHLSDIIRLISGVSSVIAVKKFSFRQPGGEFANLNEWVNNVKDKQKIPRLNIDNSSIEFLRSGDRHRQVKNNKPDMNKVKHILNYLQASDYKSKLKSIGEDLPVPAGEFMDIESYYPFQQNLPAAYGMKEQLLDYEVSYLLIVKAIGELIENKTGANSRRFFTALLNEAEDKRDIKNIVNHLLTEYSETISVSRIADDLLDNKKNTDAIKKALDEINGEKKSHRSLKDQLISTLELSISKKSAGFYVSAKTLDLQRLVTELNQKSLTHFLEKDETLKLQEAYKKYQLENLSKQKKLILQLRGFLMVFEQILADYATQLANTKNLFSFDAAADKTLFTQTLQHINDAGALLKNYERFGNELQTLTENTDMFIERRNKILDHLLSRFSETMDRYSYFMNRFTKNKAGEKLIKDKTNFLADYVSISSYRGNGFDYTNADETWNTENVEGIKKRVCRLLGIEQYSRRDIAPSDIYIEEIRPDDKIVRYVVRLRNPQNHNDILLTSKEYQLKDEAERALNYILENGDNALLYNKEDKKNKWFFVLRITLANELTEPIAYSQDFERKEEREDALRKVIETISVFSANENFHVVEHILLRPKVNPRESNLRKSSSNINADTVKLLYTQKVPEIKLSTKREHKDTPYKFKITQARDNEQNDKVVWELSFVNDDEVILVSKEEFIFYKNVTQRINDIREYGSDKVNYTTATIGDGLLNFKIMAAERVLAESKKNYRSQDAMDEEINSLIDYFSYEMDYINNETDDDDVSFYADPYSLQVSVLIPGWQARFREPAFRHRLEKTIYMETPSHIYPHIYWLNFMEMKEFEEAYKLWLQELSSSELPDTDIVNNMIYKINELKR